jgi:hypothetical protein
MVPGKENSTVHSLSPSEDTVGAGRTVSKEERDREEWR